MIALSRLQPKCTTYTKGLAQWGEGVLYYHQ